ncbi:MAG: D-glycero-alpha-D-manno-heptose-1,7-bisphosphate 7-phosphatase [Stellaceae bacterium]
MTARAIFLDRDGVLILHHIRDGRPFSITAGEEAELFDGVREACSELAALGNLLVMVTNQPEVAVGKIPRHFVEETNDWLTRELGLDDVEVCFHDDTVDCACRKPKPGMLLNAASKLGLDLGASVMVGDRWRDIAAGKAAGCRTVLVDHGYTDRAPEPADHAVPSLWAAMPWFRTLPLP